VATTFSEGTQIDSGTLLGGSKGRDPVRRRISPNAGHALEILGHVIEYLADEYIREGGQFSARDARVEAVQLLMRLNREIYLDCPEVPTIADRWRSLLRVREAGEGASDR
jgi:hypothetical protein